MILIGKNPTKPEAPGSAKVFYMRLTQCYMLFEFSENYIYNAYIKDLFLFLVHMEKGTKGFLFFICKKNKL